MAVQAVHTRPNRWLTPQTRALQEEFVQLSNTPDVTRAAQAGFSGLRGKPYVQPLRAFVTRTNEELIKIQERDNFGKTVTFYSYTILTVVSVLSCFVEGDSIIRAVIVSSAVFMVVLATKGDYDKKIFEENGCCLSDLLRRSEDLIYLLETSAVDEKQESENHLY